MKFIFKSPNKQKRTRGIHAKKRTEWQNWREYLWPSMGWQALFRWLEIKIKRTKAGQDALSMGAAIGIFVTFIPWMGLQVILMWMLCQFLRGHFLTSVLVSLVGNPWTFPLIWLTSHQLGMVVLLREETQLPDTISISHVMGNMGYYWDTFLLPTTVGGAILGLACATATYYLVHFHVKSYQKARAAFLAHRRAEEQEKRRLRDVAKDVAIGTGAKIKDILPKKEKEEDA